MYKVLCWGVSGELPIYYRHIVNNYSNIKLVGIINNDYVPHGIDGIHQTMVPIDIKNMEKIIFL